MGISSASDIYRPGSYSASKLVSQALQFGYWSVIRPVGQPISQPGTHLDLQSDD